jgi:hypothetical protein
VPIYWDDGGSFKLLERTDGHPKTGLWADVLAAYMDATSTAGPLEWESESIAGEWIWSEYTDEPGGTSTIFVSESAGKRTYSGNVAETDFGDYTGGYAGWIVIPNAATLPYLKEASSFSFKVTGDDKIYSIQVQTSNITDYSYYRTTFTAPAAETTITIPMNSLVSPGWGQSSTGTSFNQRLVTDINFQAADDIRPGTFNITIWDLKLHQ